MGPIPWLRLSYVSIKANLDSKGKGLLYRALRQHGHGHLYFCDSLGWRKTAGSLRFPSQSIHISGLASRRTNVWWVPQYPAPILPGRLLLSPLRLLGNYRTLGKRPTENGWRISLAGNSCSSARSQPDKLRQQLLSRDLSLHSNYVNINTHGITALRSMELKF